MIVADSIILICLLLSAFFSGMEIAFVSSNRIFLEIEKRQEGFTSKILKRITKDPSRLITTLLLGNNIALVVYGIFMGERVLNLFFPEALLVTDPGLRIVFYQTLISTAIILLTAEFLPKVFFQLYANTFLKIFALPVAFFYFFFAPITFLIMGLTNFMLKYFFEAKPQQMQLSFSKVELGNYIEEQLESTDDKENLDSEIQIFQNALEFSGVKARDAMVPRADVISVEINNSVDELRMLFDNTGFSKIPVYEDNIDEIKGYIHTFEMFKKPQSLKKCLMPVAFVPEAMPVQEVLKMLTRQRKSMAVVVDEYGGTSGIVTIEDIVEELFGEIEDEHDVIAHFEKEWGEKDYEFSARLEVDYINQKYYLDLPESEHYETLGGWVAYHMGEIPKLKERIELQSFKVKITKASSTKIERIRLNKID